MRVVCNPRRQSITLLQNVTLPILVVASLVFSSGWRDVHINGSTETKRVSGLTINYFGRSRSYELLLKVVICSTKPHAKGAFS